ncbi:hypothetical protein ACWEWI_15275 [Streptomyces sp. NPDC003753]|uniref:hypothetical protein n=1 Tax=Streptomyces sp. NPDC058960 TaxID=3346679 RepID=UPI0036C9C567
MSRPEGLPLPGDPGRGPGVVTRSVGDRLPIGGRWAELIEPGDQSASEIADHDGCASAEDDGTGTVVADEQAAGAAGPSEN